MCLKYESICKHEYQWCATIVIDVVPVHGGGVRACVRICWETGRKGCCVWMCPWYATLKINRESLLKRRGIREIYNLKESYNAERNTSFSIARIKCFRIILIETESSWMLSIMCVWFFPFSWSLSNSLHSQQWISFLATFHSATVAGKKLCYHLW